MTEDKSRLNQLTKYSIFAYIIIVMISNSIGSIGVKVIRIITGLMLLLYFTKEKKVYKSSYCAWALLFLAYNAISIQSAFSKLYAFQYTMTLAYVIIMNIFICQFMCKEDIIESGAKAFIAGAVLKGILVFGTNGLLVFLSSRSTDGTSANTIGLYSAIAALICFIMILKQNKNSEKKKISIYIILIIVLIAFTVLSASRKAFIYALVPLVTYFILSGKKPLKRIANIIAIVIIIFSVYMAFTKISFLYDLVGKRIESMYNGLQGQKTDSSTKTRMNLIDAGMKWFAERKWTGYGLANFRVLNEYYRDSHFYAHNNYVELLVDCGIIGTVIYYWFYIKLLITGWKNRNMTQINPIILGIIISFIIGEYGLVTYDDAIYQLILLYIYIYLFKQKKMQKTKVEDFSDE